MGKLLLMLTFLSDVPKMDPEYKNSLVQVRYGLLETSLVKTELKDLQNDAQRKLYKYTGLTKDEVIYGAYLYPLALGKVSTKPFKNFKHTFENGFTLRPEIEYTFRNKTEYCGVLILLKEF